MVEGTPASLPMARASASGNMGTLGSLFDMIAVSSNIDFARQAAAFAADPQWKNRPVG
jgi:hypothetical protein